MLALIMVAAGVASWFVPSRAYSTPYVCAMNVVRVGTRVHILNTDNGRTSSCLVVGTGPFVAGRVLDVAPAVRRILRFDGLARVRVWIEPCRPAPVPLTCTEPKFCVVALPPRSCP